MPQDDTQGESREIVEIEDVEALKKALDDEAARAESHLANWQRAQADFTNFKRRAEQEREEIGQIVRGAVILNILPVLDDMERALDSVPVRMTKQSWVRGVRLVEQKFHSVLKTMGVTEIKAMGKQFDPGLHEAAISGKGNEGMVIKVLNRGYKLGDKIIRPARVVVGNGEEA